MKIFNDNPTLSKEVLTFIQELFPNQLPANEISIEMLRYLQGQQSVLRKLEELHNQNFEE